MQRLAPKRLVLTCGVLICGALLFIAAPAFADRAPTDAERAKVVAAMEAEGCTDGFIKVDDGIFEVDNAKCRDGHIYDLKFDPAFKLIDKDLEH
ncbi:MAG: PepSY domain-containing protein [Pseudomonadota bacterium]